MDELLDSKIAMELREIVNKTNIFIKDKKEKKKFNVLCATMDRIDTAVNYINRNYNIFPELEEMFVVYLYYTCHIVETVNVILEKLDLKRDKGNNYFEVTWNKLANSSEIKEDFCDDDFFKYVRSLIFAHPTATDTSIPDKIDKEHQYSPYILLDAKSFSLNGDDIGIEIYSNKRNDFCLTMRFETINNFLKWKYEQLKEVNNQLNEIISKKEEKWKLHKVNRELDNEISILEAAQKILKERYMDTDIIENLICFMICECTLEENVNSVEKYREAIKELVPNICDAIDNYEHEKIYEIVDDILYARPIAHRMLSYQLEKINCYLNDEYGDTEWGLRQAEAFSNEFAKKWVIIKPREMSFNEIKMLTQIACYFEYMEQIKQNK